MGVIDRIASGLGFTRKSAAALPTQGYLPTLGATPSASGLAVSQSTAMAVSTVNACVRIRAQDIARCRPGVYRRDSKGRRVELGPDDHPLARLFRKPNRAQTWFEFAEQQAVAYLLRGNAYAPVRRDDRGRPVEMVPVNPDATLVLESSDGGVFYNVNRIGLWQIAMLRGFPPSIAAEDMWHLRSFTFNALVGVSTIGLARDAIGLAMGHEQQASRWMANGSRPSYALMKKDGKLSEEAAKRLKLQWNELTQGINKTGTTVILEEGLEPKPLTLTAGEIELIAQRNFSVLDLARIWGIPGHKIGVEQMRGVNTVQVEQNYVNSTVMPDLHRFEQKFEDYFGLADQGLEVHFDETVLLRADVTTRFNNARIGLMSGFLAPNEVRDGEGLPPVEGGDAVYRPLNMAALGSDMSGVAPDNAGRPAHGAPAPGAAPGAGEALDDGKAEDGLEFLRKSLQGSDLVEAHDAETV